MFPKHYLLHITKGKSLDSKPFYSQQNLARFLRANGVHFSNADLSNLEEDSSLILESRTENCVFEVEILLEPKIPKDVLFIEDKLFVSRARYCLICSISEKSCNNLIDSGEINSISVGKNNRVYIEMKWEDPEK